MAEDKKEVRQIAQGHLRKRTVLDKATEMFITEDARTVGQTILEDYVIPGIKNAFLTSIEMLLFGASSRGGRRNYGTHTSYSKYYYSDRDRNDPPRKMANVNRSSRFDYVDYGFDDIADVTRVIQDMSDYIRDYDDVSVAILNQFIGITGKFTDKNWGWNDARDFSWKRVGRYYYLDFAEPIPLQS